MRSTNDAGTPEATSHEGSNNSKHPILKEAIHKSKDNAQKSNNSEQCVRFTDAVEVQITDS